MEQHPVPQHIASYEFRLVGDMTLKQFFQLAAGIGVALFFYATPLPIYFKWPLIIFFSFLGFAFAFMPIEERPLGQWLVAFAKAVVSPTLYVWKKSGETPDILKPRPYTAAVKPPSPSAPDQKMLGEFLASLPAAPATDPPAVKEDHYLEKVTQLFQTANLPAPPKTTFIPEPPPVSRPAFNLPPTPKVVQAITSPHLPIPAPPTRSNILVGMVTDKNGEIIEGAILEIRDSKKIPVRALRTNRLGQFQIVTPLENGTYEIEVEKEGFQFDIIKLEAKGEIIKPIEIKAK